MTTPLPDYGINFNNSTNTQVLDSSDSYDYAALFLGEQIKDPNYNYHLEAAQLWAIKKDNTFYLLASNPDVYELLENEDYNLSSYNGILIHTTGWAAPLGSNGEVEGKPSAHPQRRRVALVSCVTSKSTSSALSFPDEDDIITDPGTATGSLAEALQNFWNNNKDPF